MGIGQEPDEMLINFIVFHLFSSCLQKLIDLQTHGFLYTFSKEFTCGGFVLMFGKTNTVFQVQK